MIRVVAGLLLNDDGEALFGLRKSRFRRGALWETPGGKVEACETPEAALIREWNEELGSEIAVQDFIASAAFDLEISFVVDLYVVVGRVSQLHTPTAHDEIRWMLPSYAVEYMPCAPAFYTHYPTIRRLIAQRGRNHD